MLGERLYERMSYERVQKFTDNIYEYIKYDSKLKD